MSDESSRTMILLFVLLSAVIILSTTAVLTHNQMNSKTIHEVKISKKTEQNWTFERVFAVPRDGEVELTWNLSNNNSEEVSISHYNIIKNGENYTQVEGTSYLDDDVENGIKYTYRIEAVNEDGQVIAATEELNATPESYWWLWVALPINITALVLVIYYLQEHRDELFLGE